MSSPARAGRRPAVFAGTDSGAPRPRGGPLHRSAYKSDFFSWTVHGPFSFCQEQKENGGWNGPAIIIAESPGRQIAAPTPLRRSTSGGSQIPPPDGAAIRPRFLPGAPLSPPPRPSSPWRRSPFLRRSFCLWPSRLSSWRQLSWPWSSSPRSWTRPSSWRRPSWKRPSFSPTRYLRVFLAGFFAVPAASAGAPSSVREAASVWALSSVFLRG